VQNLVLKFSQEFSLCHLGDSGGHLSCCRDIQPAFVFRRIKIGNSSNLSMEDRPVNSHRVKMGFQAMSRCDLIQDKGWSYIATEV
jgi:hypothetical protein